ncbi:MAG: alpha/beta hydrolase [Amaricoccus sp.]
MRASVNGTSIYFDVDGPELEPSDGGLRRRPTIVALHGGPGFDQGYLRPGLGPLRGLAQVVYVDLRGQGRSAAAAIESCTLEQMADDVAALCAATGIERPVVFGHSAGGFVAMQLALRHPELVAGLILCSTSPAMARIDDGRPPPPGVAERAGPEAAAVAARLFGGDMSPETGEAFGRLVLPFYAGPSHTDVPGSLMRLSGFSPEVARHFFGNLASGYDLRPRLGEIAAPALVIISRHDWVTPPASGRAIAAGIPGARLVELAESGHFGFSEEPERFLEAVSGFLADLPDVRRDPVA